MTKQRGFSLIEIMISLVIGSIILGAGIQILSASKQNYRLIESLSRLQENARYVMETMAFDLRMTGYQVCGETSGKANIITGGEGTWYLDVFGNTLEGYESGAGIADLPVAGEGVLVAGTDAVSFKSLGLEDAFYIESHDEANAVFVLNKNASFDVGELAVVCDAGQTTVFQVSSATAGADTVDHDTGGAAEPGNCTRLLGGSCGSAASYEFSSDAQMFHIESSIYYIGLGADGVTPGLYKAEVRPNAGATASVVPILLAPDVVNLQLEYGEDTVGDGVVDTYSNANAVGDWNAVLSVRVFLVFRSRDDFLVEAGEEQLYRLNGVDIQALDRHVYRVFSTTVGLRNRLQ